MAPPSSLSDAALRARWAELMSGASAGLALLVGPNGSGKSSLAHWLVSGVEGARLVSAETEQAFYERELREDDSNLQEAVDAGTTVAELLGPALDDSPWAERWGLRPLRERGYRQLSSGEARKVRLAQLAASQPPLLVLDEPFDGLDLASRALLWQLVADLATHVQVILVGNELPPASGPAISTVASCEQGRLVFLGDWDEWSAHNAAPLAATTPPPLQGGREPPAEPSTPLVRLRNGSVRYGEQIVFAGLELLIHPGDHTLIEGPNGSGKSSLLALLTGDHPQAYANDLELFGRKRGSGETIWDIKRHVGLLSGQLHRDYRVPASALEVIVSGWFDSIGLYERPETSVVARARAWWAWLGIEASIDTAFRALSQGEQRLVLLARAAIKEPWLLVLDEPTSRLDETNHQRVLELVASLCATRSTTVLFVSHLARDREFWLTQVSQRVVRLPVGRD
ncbi:MAG TPA: ATP-binding cassette domain-containing protein [Polyangiaceae bacterium]|nr:ATP-binding cassette domain-containing protein [Polyangiaceae bacterium]